jgi:hypothetical protein
LYQKDERGDSVPITVRAGPIRVAVFHEDLSPAQRDLEVARFAEEDGPNLLIAAESGGEGRNFQFAERLVLFDLPARSSRGFRSKARSSRSPACDQRRLEADERAARARKPDPVAPGLIA